MLTIRSVLCGSYRENAYLVMPEGRIDAFLIDPGDDMDALSRAIDLSGRTLTDILLTHGHFDHTLSAPYLHKRYGSRVWIAEADKDYLRDPKLNFLPEDLSARYTVMTPDMLITGDEIAVCGVSLRVLHTPGHTPGCVCLISDADKVMFTGDTLFADGFGRTDLAGGNFRSLMNSLRLLFREDPAYTVYPGHGPGDTLGAIMKGFHR